MSTGAEAVAQPTTNTYDYDGANSSTRKLWGRLSAVTTNAVTEHYGYTTAGLLTSKIAQYGGGYMAPEVNYSYDNEGKATQIIYPQYGRQTSPTTYDIFSQRLTLNYFYDAMGQLQKITSGSGPGVDLVNAAGYNAAGQLVTSMRASSVSVGTTTDLRPTIRRGSCSR